jgi:hypothetical protein
MSLQNAKRAAKAISTDKQEKAVLKHQANMQGKGYKPYPNTEWILHKIKEKVTLLTKRYFPPNLDYKLPVWRTPSYGACYERSSVVGGSTDFFADYTIDDQYSQPDTSTLKYSGLFSYAEQWTPAILDDYSNLHLGAYHFADLSKKDGTSFSSNDETIPIFSFGFRIDDIRRDLNYNIEKRFENLTRTTCRYSMVLEPFKVRGVTMGESSVYQMGRLIQPVLHGQLRDENGPFRLIGKRHNEDDINKVYSGTILNTQDYLIKAYQNDSWGKEKIKTFFVAGDFSDATDNMHPDIPYTFIDTLRCNKTFNELWIKVLELTLGGHKIEYDLGSCGLFFNDYPEFKDHVIQEWGQLMGSPTSFPVLNICNAAMFWASCEIYENRLMSWDEIIEAYKCLFNGDDTSFLSNIFHYDTWAVTCAAAGLSLSPGKNYCSSEFININSTNYFGVTEPLDDGFFKVSDFKELFVVNPGLIKGQSKVLGGTGDFLNSLGSTCDQLEECIRVASPEEKTRCYEVFEHHMKIRLQSSKRNWKLPRLFGGLGLPFGKEPSLLHKYVAISQLSKYRDLTDDSVKKENDRMALDYFKQICMQQNIEVVKPNLVQNDVKLDDIQTEAYKTETYYNSPSLTACFLNHFIRQRTIATAKSLLFPRNKWEAKTASLYKAVFDFPQGSIERKRHEVKFEKNLKFTSKRYSEIEMKRIGHSVQAEKSFCLELKKARKTLRSLPKVRKDSIGQLPLGLLKNFSLEKNGLKDDIMMGVSKALRKLNKR